MSPWKIYERMIAQMMSDQIDVGLCITPNARITGRLSGISRQIDILIEPRHSCEKGRRSIIEAKHLRRKVHIKDVENLLGMMEDVDAAYGYLVCPTGYSKAALRRAQDTVRICLVPLDHIAAFDPTAWPPCMSNKCKKGKIFWDGYTQIELIAKKIDAPDDKLTILKFPHKVGKCESCNAFHAHCLTCDEQFTIMHDDDNDVGVQCSCRLPWFWIGSIESDDRGQLIAELRLISGSGRMMTVNRRPL